MKALRGVWISAPLVSVDLITISITNTSQVTEIVHPAAIPISNRCHSVVKSSIMKLS
jgi:hypothetical protein